MRAEETPVFVRTYDFIRWLLPHSAKFPRVRRHTLTNRLELSVLDLQGALVAANRRRGERRGRALEDADGHLDAVRFLVRLAADFGYLSGRQQAFAAERLAEIGRLIGGWRRSEERRRTREGAGAGRSRQA